MVSKKKSQSFSTDILVVVIIVLFGALFIVMNKINDTEEGPAIDQKYEQASLQANQIYDSLKKTEVIDEENKVDVERLLSVNDEDLKKQLGIQGKFCIVFEKDGKLVKIDPDNNVNGIGSDDIVVNGVPCR